MAMANDFACLKCLFEYLEWWRFYSHIDVVVRCNPASRCFVRLWWIFCLNYWWNISVIFNATCFFISKTIMLYVHTHLIWKLERRGEFFCNLKEPKCVSILILFCRGNTNEFMCIFALFEHDLVEYMNFVPLPTKKNQIKHATYRESVKENSWLLSLQWIINKIKLADSHASYSSKLQICHYKSRNYVSCVFICEGNLCFSWQSRDETIKQ